MKLPYIIVTVVDDDYSLLYKIKKTQIYPILVTKFVRDAAWMNEYVLFTTLAPARNGVQLLVQKHC